MSGVLDGVAATLRNHIDRLNEELDTAERMLRILQHGPGPNQPELFESCADVVPIGGATLRLAHSRSVFDPPAALDGG